MKAQKVILSLVFVLVALVLGNRGIIASDKISDEEITKWVKEALMEDPRVNIENIHFKTKDGIVRLTGTVNNLDEKKYAELESKKIRGVVGVIDELTLTPAYRSDSDIEADVLKRLTGSPFINIKNLMVRVSNGTVILTGQVSSWIELKEADDLASEVRGVRSLEDDLVIKFKTERSDEAILRDVEDLLDRDVYLYNLPINASVNNGKVILEGTVGSPYEKERAELDALGTMNVTSVENRIKIKPAEVYGVKQEDREPSDQEIKQYVETELNEDPRIDPFEIKVDVSEGVVTLSGSIPDFYERRIAENDTRDVVGVLDVDNQLTVLTIENVDKDETIFIDVENRIQSNDVLSGERIKVQVDDGVVILTGRVSNYWEIHYATEVVSRVMGVRDIINNLTVNKLTNLKDDILEYKIKHSLESDWLTSLVSDNIKVTVKDGIATLQGKVDTYSEYREAARVTSRTTGIWKVVNNLTFE